MPPVRSQQLSSPRSSNTTNPLLPPPWTFQPATDGDPKPVREFNEDSEIAFFTNVFKFEGTIFADVWPQMIAILLWT